MKLKRRRAQKPGEFSYLSTSKRLFTVALAAGLVFGATNAALAVEKRFSIRCERGHEAQVDPIVSPGMPSEHLHQFFGNDTTNFDSTYQSMVGSETSCDLSKDTAAYWVPTLMDDQTHELIPASHVNAYYRSISGLADEVIQPFPPDLRMISGDFEWLCKDVQAYPTKTDCEPGQMMGLRIIFPSCWDGVNLDSPDHMSHMAHQTAQGCPDSHPVALPRLAINVRWPVSDATHTMLSSEMMGIGPHGDFWNTWDQDTLAQLVDTCLGQGATELCGRQSDGNLSGGGTGGNPGPPPPPSGGVGGDEDDHGDHGDHDHDGDDVDDEDGGRSELPSQLPQQA